MSSCKKRNKKVTLSKVIDLIFYTIYIVLFILTILDMFSIPIPLVDNYIKDGNNLLRLLLMLFSSVGIVILNDKREMAKKVVSPLKYIEQSISNGESNNSNFIFLSNKDEFYMFFTQEIRHLKSGAEILVTAFDKNKELIFILVKISILKHLWMIGQIK